LGFSIDNAPLLKYNTNKTEVPMKVCLKCKNNFRPRSNNQKHCDPCRNKKCLFCNQPFIKNRLSSKHCSRECYLKSRWVGIKNCKYCGKKLKKKELRYCSKKCRRLYWNQNEYQLTKKKRIWERKKEIIGKLGGKCTDCGNSDLRVLDINHIDRTKKTRPKKGQYSWQHRLKEWESNMGNLELLCANCHRIHTYIQMNYGDKKVQKRDVNYSSKEDREGK